METDALLNAVEVRVLGALLEKEITTPDYYPLTLNALTAACNQKSNRHPVVEFDEKTVARALEGLREKGLARMISGAEWRVPKYYHLMADKLGLARPAVAVLCVLMLRGPQTVGEIRGRTGRMHEFADLAEVETTLQGLMDREGGPLVAQLPRQPGRKESRCAHLLAGEPEVPEEEEDEPHLEPATLAVQAENERLARLEEEVAALRQELAALQEAFAGFKSQFE
jgi:uncharacterized protein YceH (UPF0502 family)